MEFELELKGSFLVEISSNDLLDRMNRHGKYRQNVIETNSETTSYKHKGERSKYPDSETSSEIKPKSHRERQRCISDSRDSDRKHRKKKYKPTKRSPESSRK